MITMGDFIGFKMVTAITRTPRNRYKRTIPPIVRLRYDRSTDQRSENLEKMSCTLYSVDGGGEILLRNCILKALAYFRGA